MQSPEATQWHTVDLPLLRELVDAYDAGGPFALAQDSFRVADDWSAKDFAFAAKRLADTGYIDAQYRAGGFVHSVGGVTDKGRQVASGRAGRQQADASAPRLDALGDELRVLLTQTARALQVEPDHPNAARWRAFLQAGLNVGTGLTAATVGEVTRALTAGRRP